VKERQMTEVKLIRPGTMNYCDIFCNNAITSTMTLRIGGMQQQRNGTRMTRIGRISTDTHYPCASASSAQSVFYCTNALFDDDKKPQMNADERTINTFGHNYLNGAGVRPQTPMDAPPLAV